MKKIITLLSIIAVSAFIMTGCSDSCGDETINVTNTGSEINLATGLYALDFSDLTDTTYTDQVGNDYVVSNGSILSQTTILADPDNTFLDDTDANDYVENASPLTFFAYPCPNAGREAIVSYDLSTLWSATVQLSDTATNGQQIIVGNVYLNDDADGDDTPEANNAWSVIVTTGDGASAPNVFLMNGDPSAQAVIYGYAMVALNIDTDIKVTLAIDASNAGAAAGPAITVMINDVPVIARNNDSTLGDYGTAAARAVLDALTMTVANNFYTPAEAAGGAGVTEPELYIGSWTKAVFFDTPPAIPQDVTKQVTFGIFFKIGDDTKSPSVSAIRIGQ